MERVTTTYDHFDHFQDYASTTKPTFPSKRKLITLSNKTKVASLSSSKKYLVNYIQCKQCMRLLGEEEWPTEQTNPQLINCLKLKNVSLDATQCINFYQQKNRKKKNSQNMTFFPEQQKITIECSNCKLKVGFIKKNIPFFEKNQIVSNIIRYCQKIDSKTQQIKPYQKKVTVQSVYEQLLKYIQTFNSQHQINSQKIGKLQKTTAELESFISFYNYYRGRKNQKKCGSFVDGQIN